MKLKEGFVLRTVCGEKVIVGEGLGAVNFNKLLSINDSAAWIWETAAKMGDFTAESVAEALCEQYEVSPETALADVTTLLEQWKGLGVVE